MATRSPTLVIVALSALLALSTAAHARGGWFVGVGPYWGPFWGGWAYPYYPYPFPGPYPYAYYPPAYDEGRFYTDAPSEYVERDPVEDDASASSSDGYWYFCPSARGYYPDVPECRDAWIKVPARSSATYRDEEGR